MQSVFPIEAYRANLTSVVESVFATMMGLEVEPAETAWTETPDRVTAVVHFVGSWSGAVVLECNPEQTSYFTRLLLPSHPADVLDDDARDALGELANMLAGNLKATLPKGICLSAPSVTVGSDYSVRICGRNMIERLSFDSPCGAFWITLVEIITRERPD